MNRRDFLSTIATAIGAIGLTGISPSNSIGVQSKSDWALNFAPHLGITNPENGLFRELAGKDPIDQIKFAADHGFTGVEDNFLKLRPKDTQMRIGEELAKCEMRMGCFVNNIESWNQITFTSDKPEAREQLLKEMRSTLELAEMVNGKWVTTLSGYTDPTLEPEYQMTNMVENLKYLAEVAEPKGLILGVEAINSKDFPGTFLTKVTDAYQIVKAVNSPAVKIVFDTYHAQIEVGDIIRNIDYTWDEIGMFQIADNPGRAEPGTGEINYNNVLRHIHEKGWSGLVEMEHFASEPGKQGERKVLERYKEVNRILKS